MVRYFNSTVTGASHIEIGKECQDASLIWHNDETNMTIAVVSDGHGGDRYVNSARGSELACQVALDVLRDMAGSASPSFSDLLNTASMQQQLSGCIVSRWIQAIDRERGEQDLETYGCTLIAYMQKGADWLALQIGDGSLALMAPDGEWKMPVPEDERCFLNFTTSMCDRAAAGEFRFATSIGHGAAQAVFLASDGIDNTFVAEETQFGFYQHLLEDIRSGRGLEEVTNLMPEILEYYSSIGSGDDMSLACIIND